MGKVIRMPVERTKEGYNKGTSEQSDGLSKEAEDLLKKREMVFLVLFFPMYTHCNYSLVCNLCFHVLYENNYGGHFSRCREYCS